MPQRIKRQDFKAFLTHCEHHKIKVDDLVDHLEPGEPCCVFLLESPHIQEVKQQVPVAGASGRTMSRALLGCDRPLGLLVGSEREAYPLLKRIGLMNVCQVPMRKTAYRLDERRGFDYILSVLKKLRTNTRFAAHLNPALVTVRSLILADLEKRMLRLTGHRCLFIPCGLLATVYLQRVSVKGEGWSFIWGMPHPARNRWTSVQDKVRSLKSHINP